MKVKRLKLRGYVLPVFCLLLVGAIIYSSYKVWELVQIDKNKMVPTHYVNKTTSDSIIPTISESREIIKPFIDETVEESISFYNKDESEKEQEKSIILYENIYMPNTGILYSSNNEFDVVAVLDGKIKNIKEDTLMGKIIEIEHNQNLTTIYQCLNNINVSVGQEVKQGEILGKASHNQLVLDNRYALHFEVFRNGEIINPNDFYNLSYDEVVNE